jgi:hypothetical protein
MRLCCKLFLKVVPLNYDLVLYWVIQSVNKTIPKKFYDGMSRPVIGTNDFLKFYDGNNKYNVHFLHCAVHLLTEQSGDTIKLRVNPDLCG